MDLLLHANPGGRIESDVTGFHKLHRLAANAPQGEKIFRFASLLGTRRVNLMFDCEATGVEGAKDALWYFAERLLDVRLVWSPGMYGAAYLGQQPESLGEDEVKALVR